MLSEGLFWNNFALRVTRYIVLIVLSVMIQHKNMPHTNTILCIFQENTLDAEHSLQGMDYRLYAIPEIISAISYIMILVGAIESLCAQIPYSMKGLIVGIFYGSMVISLVLNKVTVYVFTLKWEAKSVFSCEFWYFQTKLIFLSITILCAFIVLVYYKKRKRDDVLPNEQIFAERYYSKKLQCK